MRSQSSSANRPGLLSSRSPIRLSRRLGQVTLASRSETRCTCESSLAAFVSLPRGCPLPQASIRLIRGTGGADLLCRLPQLRRNRRAVPLQRHVAVRSRDGSLDRTGVHWLHPGSAGRSRRHARRRRHVRLWRSRRRRQGPRRPGGIQNLECVPPANLIRLLANPSWQHDTHSTLSPTLQTIAGSCFKIWVQPRAVGVAMPWRRTAPGCWFSAAKATRAVGQTTRHWFMCLTLVRPPQHSLAHVQKRQGNPLRLAAKIKYPPDSRPTAQQQQQQQQLANSASSPPIQSPRGFAGSPPPPPLSPPPQHLPPTVGASSTPAVKRKPSIPVQMSAGNGTPEDARNRAASPTGSLRDRDHERRGLQSSLGAVAAVAATATGPTAPTSTQIPSSSSAPVVSLGSPTQTDSLGAGAGAKPPTRPARPDDADAFRTASPATTSSSTFAGGAIPPTGRARASTLTGNDIDARQRQASGGSEPQQQPPLDAFYYRGPAAAQAATSTSAQVAPSHEHERVEKLKSEKAWLLLEVERLTTGVAPADGAEGAEKPKGHDGTSVDRELREALLELKKELANAQVSSDASDDESICDRPGI